jgi:hypothetical protein
MVDGGWLIAAGGLEVCMMKTAGPWAKLRPSGGALHCNRPASSQGARALRIELLTADFADFTGRRKEIRGIGAIRGCCFGALWTTRPRPHDSSHPNRRQRTPDFRWRRQGSRRLVAGPPPGPFSWPACCHHQKQKMLRRLRLFAAAPLSTNNYQLSTSYVPPHAARKTPSPFTHLGSRPFQVRLVVVVPATECLIGSSRPAIRFAILDVRIAEQDIGPARMTIAGEPLEQKIRLLP